MGLFNKFKKENKVEENDELINENKTVIEKTLDSNEKIELENKLNNLQEEIKEKNERLSIIIEKIELSKKEYDEIIGKIIQSKKELRSQNNLDSNTNQKTEAKMAKETTIGTKIADILSTSLWIGAFPFCASSTSVITFASMVSWTSEFVLMTKVLSMTIVPATTVSP